MAGAANAAKGGFVREALVGAFPRLAALLEDTLAKLQRDTNVSHGSCMLYCKRHPVQSMRCSAMVPGSACHLAAPPLLLFTALPLPKCKGDSHACIV